MDWINSGKTIVTVDTLGMHLGIALKKEVFALFGPTSAYEVDFYGRGKAIFPDPLPECAPCFLEECKFPERYGKTCVNDISAYKVYAEIGKLTNTDFK